MEGIAEIHPGTYPGVHHVGIGTIHLQCPARHLGGVVHGYGLEVGTFAPVLVEYEEQFLRPAKRKHGYEASSASRDYPFDGPRDSAAIRC